VDGVSVEDEEDGAAVVVEQGRFKIHNADPLLSRRREFRAD